MVFGNSRSFLGRRRRVFARSFDRRSPTGHRRTVRIPRRGRGVGRTQSRNRSRHCAVRFPRWPRSCAKRCGGSNKISPTCRTSNSPSRTASCGCCRRARRKRTPQAALRLAIDFVKEGRIAPAEALRRLDGLNSTLAHHQAAGRRRGAGWARHRRIGRRCGRPRGFRSGQCHAAGGKRRPGHSGATRHDDRRCRRLRRIRRHRDRDRRPHRPCGAGGAAAGKTVHRRLRRSLPSTSPVIARSLPGRRSKKAIGSRSMAKPEQSISAAARSSASGRKPSWPKSSAGVTACAAPLPRPRDSRPFSG